MLARSERIPGKEFPAAARKILASPELTVKAAPNGRPHNRFGVILSAKIEPSSVRRHRVKRSLLARARKLPPRGIDILFIVLRPASLLTPGTLDRRMDDLGRTLTQ